MADQQQPLAGPGITWAIIIVSSAAAAVLLTAPLLVGEMVRNMGLSEAQAGYIISAELGGMALATLPAYLWLRGVQTARVFKVALICFLFGNIISVVYTLGEAHFALLFLLRFATALAGGSMMIICLTSMRLYQKPERLYAFFVLGQLVFGAAWIALLPAVFEATGLYIFYVMVIGLTLIALPLLKFFPSAISQQTANAGVGQSNGWLLPLFCLAGIFLFYVSLGGVWAFVERIATASSISPSTIGYVLSLATLLGVAGALAAVWLGGKSIKAYLPVAGGLGLLTLAIVLLRGEQSVSTLMTSTGTFKFCWSFALPFMLGCVARIDVSGLLMTSINLIIGGGTAVGPAVAAYTLTATGSYSTLLMVFSFTSLTSLILMTFVAARVSR